MDWNDPEERAAENMRLLKDEEHEAYEASLYHEGDVVETGGFAQKYSFYEGTDGLQERLATALVPMLKEIAIEKNENYTLARVVAAKLMGVIEDHFAEFEDEI